jgi:hypothetical protein
MRRIILPLALTGLVTSAPGCDVEDPLGDLGGDDTEDPGTGGGTDTSTGGTDTSTGGTDTETPVATEYFAIVVDDSKEFPEHRTSGDPCATSSVGAHGADIDAVELKDETGGNLGYFDSVRLEVGAFCEDNDRFEPVAAVYRDVEEVKGAPDGKLTENFVSLGGGYVIGEFSGAPVILPGYTVVVYEVGAAVDGQDEGFTVFVAEGLSCGQNGGDRTACQVEIGSGDGQATLTDISGF